MSHEAVHTKVCGVVDFFSPLYIDKVKKSKNNPNNLINDKI